MIKRNIITVIILFLAIFTLTGCGSSSASDEKAVVDILEAADYTLESYDKETYDYFAGQVKDTFDLTVTVNKMYQGYVYVDSNPTRFVRVVVLANDSQAEDYYDELVAVKNETEYIYRMGSVVVYTNSQETFTLFNNKS
jgi:ABC-type Fe3+-hydroxamate transport system substrate-binding protein